MNNLVSIIIPIYNTGEYLHKCISSVLSQTLTDFELILVNDGSKDNSGQICDEYARKDSRIKVIHKENAGVSAARNDGIKLACGEYIGFIDSDDWIDSSMYEELYGLAKQNDAQIVMCDTVSVFDNKPTEPDTINQLRKDVLLEKEDLFPSLLLEMAGSACRCIYKSSLIKENNVLFPVGIKLSEDRIFNILAFGYSNNIYYTKTALYNRYMREGSAVNKYYENKLQMALDAKTKTEQALDMVWKKDEYKTMYLRQFVVACYSAISDTLSKACTFSFLEKYNEVKKICSNDSFREAITSLNSKDLRAKLVTKRRIFLLCVITFLQNVKNGR